MKSKATESLDSEYHVMGFGKYKGHTIKWILANNPSYIIWLRHHDIPVNPKIYTKAQALHEKECDLKAKAYEHLNHNYSSYYEDEPSWLESGASWTDPR